MTVVGARERPVSHSDPTGRPDQILHHSRATAILGAVRYTRLMKLGKEEHQ